MADAILMSGGVGGVTSDDVTAKRGYVLQGYTALTSDSDDEPVQGTMVNRGTWNMASEVANNPGERTVHTRFEEGFYPKDGQYKPTAKIPYAVLANVLGIDANKMLSNFTVAGTTGRVKMINTQDSNYRSNKSTNFGIDYWSDSGNPILYLDLPYGNGYYYRADNSPHTCIDASNLGTAGADSVLQWQTASSQRGLKFEGTIPRWICSTGDVISADNSTIGPGLVYDDPHGRGRGIVVGIKNNAYIQGANYVFLPLPTLLAHNVREGVNIGGMVGTMKDYGAGRTVFNGATFDGILASGVANKGFYLNNNYYAYWLADFYKYAGIYDGGINLAISTGWPAFRSRRVGCVLSQSINVTPFRSIVISYHAKADIEGKPYASLEAHVSLASGRSLVNVEGKQIDSIRMLKQTFASVQITRNGQMVIDVSDINDFIFLSFGAYCNYDKTSDKFEGAIQITKIDFLN